MKVLHCDLTWVNEIYPFKNGNAKLWFQLINIDQYWVWFKIVDRNKKNNIIG